MRKKLKLAYVIFFCTTLVWAQENQPLLGETVSCEEMKTRCLFLGSQIEGEHVIRNNAEYQTLLQERSPHPDCGTYQLPAIDFSEHTLIGYISSIAGCKFPEIEHEIRRINDHYTVGITITQHGFCKRGFSVELWCLIPKIDENSIVEFDIETIKKSN